MPLGSPTSSSEQSDSPTSSPDSDSPTNFLEGSEFPKAFLVWPDSPRSAFEEAVKEATEEAKTIRAYQATHAPIPAAPPSDSDSTSSDPDLDAGSDERSGSSSYGQISCDFSECVSDSDCASAVPHDPDHTYSSPTASDGFETDAQRIMKPYEVSVGGQSADSPS